MSCTLVLTNNNKASQAIFDQLDLFLDDLRKEVAVAGVLRQDDDLGEIPQRLKEFVAQAENHLDGAKSLVKRLKQSINRGEHF